LLKADAEFVSEFGLRHLLLDTAQSETPAKFNIVFGWVDDTSAPLPPGGYPQGSSYRVPRCHFAKRFLATNCCDSLRLVASIVGLARIEGAVDKTNNFKNSFVFNAVRNLRREVAC
jgi:hypothetical protein